MSPCVGGACRRLKGRMSQTPRPLLPSPTPPLSATAGAPGARTDQHLMTHDTDQHLITHDCNTLSHHCTTSLTHMTQTNIRFTLPWASSTDSTPDRSRTDRAPDRYTFTHEDAEDLLLHHNRQQLDKQRHGRAQYLRALGVRAGGRAEEGTARLELEDWSCKTGVRRQELQDRRWKTGNAVPGVTPSSGVKFEEAHTPLQDTPLQDTPRQDKPRQDTPRQEAHTQHVKGRRRLAHKRAVVLHARVL